MLKVLKSINDPSNLTDEQIMNAYEIIKKYCDENNTDVLTLVNNDENIKPASVEIHQNLPWLIKKTISAEKIENLILTNIDFIREKALHFYELDNPKEEVIKESVAKEKVSKNTKVAKELKTKEVKTTKKSKKV